MAPGSSHKLASIAKMRAAKRCRIEFWNEWRLYILYALRRLGYSWRECGLMLGCTRNAAMSKWHGDRKAWRAIAAKAGSHPKASTTLSPLG